MGGGLVRMIGIGLLHAHPGNANVMGVGDLRKLRREIGRSGRYEPLVVRPHPGREGEFQLINGHHRKRVLEELGHKEAACLVWELDDAETLLLLATVNRLSGKDNGRKRLGLLRELGKLMPVERFAMSLPEDEGRLRRMLAGGVELPREVPGVEEMEEAFTVFLKRGEVRRLRAALAGTDGDVGEGVDEVG